MTIELRAPAKLTLTLRITGVRDDGYHLIDAEMVALELCDVLTVEPDGDWLRVEGPFARGVPVDSTNLVARALASAGRTAGVTVAKNIPHGGGLGGGSADAGAILRWAGVDDPAVAVRVGADVAFCASGLPRARVRGIGEILDPLPARDIPVTLVIPPVSVPTAAVYAAWDCLDETRRHGQVNDLENAAVMVEPRLKLWRDRITEVVGTATLAGSGSTWFAEGHHIGLAEALPEASVVFTRSVSH